MYFKCNSGTSGLSCYRDIVINSDLSSIDYLCNGLQISFGYDVVDNFTVKF